MAAYMGGYAEFPDPLDEAGVAQYQHQHHPHFDHQHHANSAIADPNRAAFYGPNGIPSIACDIKPRLTKEQHDILEREYKANHKPSTSVKKGFAENLGVSLDKVNVSI
jgi:hypothetical protein